MGEAPEGAAVPAAVEGARARCFYSGTRRHPVYVDRFFPPSAAAGRLPLVMLHGGGHTGTCWMATPDGRAGWAPIFAAGGRDVFVADWPGHGRSPMAADFAGLGTEDIARALLAVLEDVGPAILVTHSAAGPIGWWMAEQRPDLVAAIVGIAPGPPANLLPDLPGDPAAILVLKDDESVGCPVYAPEDRPVWFGEAFAAAYWANAPRFPQAGLAAYLRSIVPESARVLNERFNIGGRGLRIRDPANVAGRPILIVTGDHDRRHPRAVDGATAAYLGATFLWLPDHGITGNGHMMMIEDNSDAIARLIGQWLDGLPVDRV